MFNKYFFKVRISYDSKKFLIWKYSDCSGFEFTPSTDPDRAKTPGSASLSDSGSGAAIGKQVLSPSSTAVHKIYIIKKNFVWKNEICLRTRSLMSKGNKNMDLILFSDCTFNEKDFTLNVYFNIKMLLLFIYFWLFVFVVRYLSLSFSFCHTASLLCTVCPCFFLQIDIYIYVFSSK